MSDAPLFGKYRLVRRLAFGGMAEIFLARLVGDQGFEKTLVLKRILPQFSSDPDFTRMFVDEAVLAARLTHTNVAQVYDFGEVDGVYFITMELVDGADLRRIIRGANEKGRGLEPAEVAAIGEGMARGLAYVHDLTTDEGRPLGIIHRDVSPHNVMLTRGGDVKVMDFGIAKAAARATHTATGTIKGKLAYMAPEQALAEEIDQRADQYAVGLTLWECLVGRRAFEGDSEPELLSRVAAGRVRDLRTEKADVPEELARIVMRMVSLKRDDRYPNLHQVEHELATFRFGLGAAGAVRLSGLVDELAPREPPKPVAPKQGTAVLPGAEASQPSVPSQGTGELSVESGWSSRGETEVTRAATPEMLQAAPTVLLPKRKPLRLWASVTAATLVVAALVGTVASRTIGDRRAVLTLESDPAGAEVLLEQDGRVLTTGVVTPTAIPGKRGDVVRYRLARDGYVADGGAVSLTEATQTERRTLQRVAAPPVPEAPAAQPSTVEEPATPKAKTSPEASKKKGAAVGYVTFGVTGNWFEVRLNNRSGKLLGNSFEKDLAVPAGIVSLYLSNDNGFSKTLVVNLAPGEHKKQPVDTR